MSRRGPILSSSVRVVYYMTTNDLLSHFSIAKLANSRYGSPEIIEQMKEIFDKTTKLRFRDADDPQYIKFGTVRDKEPEYDIRSGQLKLVG